MSDQSDLQNRVKIDRKILARSNCLIATRHFPTNYSIAPYEEVQGVAKMKTPEYLEAFVYGQSTHRKTDQSGVTSDHTISPPV